MPIMKLITKLTTKDDEVRLYEIVERNGRDARLTFNIAYDAKLTTTRARTILKKLEKHGYVERVPSVYKTQIKWRVRQDCVIPTV